MKTLDTIDACQYCEMYITLVSTVLPKKLPGEAL